ncbi:MAG: hypothetical protein ACR2KZ_19010, partial [Segetibacter sp.]
SAENAEKYPFCAFCAFWGSNYQTTVLAEGAENAEKLGSFLRLLRFLRERAISSSYEKNN